MPLCWWETLKYAWADTGLVVPIAKKARLYNDWFNYGKLSPSTKNIMRECGLKYKQMFDQDKGDKLFRPTFNHQISKACSPKDAQCWVMGRQPIPFLAFLLKN